MYEIMTTVLDTFMDAPNDFFRGSAFFRAMLGLDLIELALGFGESILFLTEEARVLDELAIGQGDEGFESNVNTNGLHVFREAFGLIITREADVPLIAFTTDGASFNYTRANTVDFGFDLPDFGKRDSAFSDTVSALRIGDAVVLAFAFKSWASRLFSKFNTAEEGLKGEFYTHRDVLQNLTMNSH